MGHGRGGGDDDNYKDEANDEILQSISRINHVLV